MEQIQDLQELAQEHNMQKQHQQTPRFRQLLHYLLEVMELIADQILEELFGGIRNITEIDIHGLSYWEQDQIMLSFKQRYQILAEIKLVLQEAYGVSVLDQLFIYLLLLKKFMVASQSMLVTLDYLRLRLDLEV